MSADKRVEPALTELDDEKVRKDEILSNRDKAQRVPGQSFDGEDIQVDEYKDNVANRRPVSNADNQSDANPAADELTKSSPTTSKQEPTREAERVDRPGFDLGGSSGETSAGKGLGLGSDAQENRKGWRLPR